MIKLARNPLSLLDPAAPQPSNLEELAGIQAAHLLKALETFNVEAALKESVIGPTVTRHQLELRGTTRLSQVENIADDVALRLGVPSLRVLLGTGTVDIELPSAQRRSVRLVEVLSDAKKMQLPVFLGVDAAGQPLVEDVARMPHVLIAGTTGSGKSVLLNSIIASLLLTRTAEQVRFVLVDPKMVEMVGYAGVPHLLRPVITDMSDAAAAMEWAVSEMERRYELLSLVGKRNLTSYNETVKDPLPSIVFVVDELADLMMQHKEVEAPIVRIAQKARAVGIHLVLATQRPQANVVTGLIKGNMPTRIACKVASNTDSRIILDQGGAERLLGQGDMLFSSPRSPDVSRAQGVWIPDEELERIVTWAKKGPAGRPFAPAEEKRQAVAAQPTRDWAREWLKQYLRVPSTPAAVLVDGKKAGFDKKVLFAAAEALEVQMVVHRRGATVWRLPQRPSLLKRFFRLSA